MQLQVQTESPLTPDALTLIEGSEAALREVYSEEECFSFSPSELAQRNVQFLVARGDGQPLGCVALVDLGSYAEIKRLYVTPQARGLGVAQALMQAAERAASDLGLATVRLETGDKLAAAVGLYRQIGYAEREAFGDYEPLDCSLFMEKRLFEPVTL